MTFSWVFFLDIDVQHPAHLGQTVFNFWPWEYCCDWVYVVLFKEHRLSVTESLAQSVELKFVDDMNISFFFDKITIDFWLKDMHYSFNMSISYSQSPLTPVL